MKLYTQSRNSAGERVRIALNLKGVGYDYVAVPSLPAGEYARINPQGLMPALEVDGAVIAQSGAILAYIDEAWPDPPLLPADPIVRAQARGFAQHVAAELHAMTVDRVRRYLEAAFKLDPAAAMVQTRHWTALGLAALEASLAGRAQSWPFCFGDQPGLADVHLIPALRNARRFGCDLGPYPNLTAVETRCSGLDAFIRARPEAQPDYVGA